jgi:hypothetical protein
MLNLARNGSLSTAPLFEQHHKLKQQRKSCPIVDFDISPCKAYLAVLYKDDTVYLYGHAEEGKDTERTLIAWCDVLHSSLHDAAQRVAFLPMATGRLAVCGEEGLTIWCGKKDPARGNARKWSVLREISGNFTTMHWSHDGKLLALGSCYSATIVIYDYQNEKLYPLTQVHATIKELMWSPMTHYLLAASTAPEFRLFAHPHYINERWTDFGGCVSVLAFCDFV